MGLDLGRILFQIDFQINSCPTQQHDTPLVMLKHYPIVTPRDGIRQYDIDELNAILRQETAKYEEDERLVVWDSYEHLLQR